MAEGLDKSNNEKEIPRVSFQTGPGGYVAECPNPECGFTNNNVKLEVRNVCSSCGTLFRLGDFIVRDEY